MTTLKPTELGSILSIWAHPDDETYLAGGIMAAAAENGQRVVCVSATAGEQGTDEPATWPPERLGRVRRWEAAAAMTVLGVTDHRFLGYVDGTLREADAAEGVGRIVDLIGEVRPDTVLTFGPDGTTFHPDHQTVSRWVGQAWIRSGRTGRLLHAALSKDHLAEWGTRYEGLGIYMTDERPVGVAQDAMAIAHHLDGAALDRKVTALAAMHSQTAGLINALDGDDFRAVVAGEWFVEAAL